MQAAPGSARRTLEGVQGARRRRTWDRASFSRFLRRGRPCGPLPSWSRPLSAQVCCLRPPQPASASERLGRTRQCVTRPVVRAAVWHRRPSAITFDRPTSGWRQYGHLLGPPIVVAPSSRRASPPGRQPPRLPDGSRESVRAYARPLCSARQTGNARPYAPPAPSVPMEPVTRADVVTSIDPR